MKAIQKHIILNKKIDDNKKQKSLENGKNW